MAKQPASVARIEPVFRSGYTRLVTERTRRGDDLPLAVGRVERAFCKLRRHWGHIVAFDSPSGWLESSLLADPPSTAPQRPEVVDFDAAWNAMRSRLERDRVRHRITVSVASVVTVALFAAGAFMESAQFRRSSPAGRAPTAQTTTPKK